MPILLKDYSVLYTTCIPNVFRIIHNISTNIFFEIDSLHHVLATGSQGEGIREGQRGAHEGGGEGAIGGADTADFALLFVVRGRV